MSGKPKMPLRGMMEDTEGASGSRAFTVEEVRVGAKRELFRAGPRMRFLMPRISVRVTTWILNHAPTVTPNQVTSVSALLGIGAAEEMEKGALAKKCPVCGFTQADFKKTGRLGCSECYVTFTEGLGSLLKAMHKGTEHVGKLPERAQRAMALSQQMRALTENLQKAVEAENYETAASLRDQIKQLESERSNSP